MYRVLVERAKDKDDNAITELYNRTYRKAYGIALNTLKNEFDAEDILQEAYIVAFTRLDRLEDPEKFEQWICQIVSNRCKDLLKKKKPVLFSEFESDEGDGDDPLDFEDESDTYQPEQIADKAETKRIIKELLDKLPEDQRLCMILYFEAEMKISEIAEALGVSENTVKSRLAYAKKKMKADVEDMRKKGTPLYGIAPVFLIPLLRNLCPSFDFSESVGSSSGGIPQSVTSGEILKPLKTVSRVIPKTAESVFTGTAKKVGKSAAKKAGKHVLRNVLIATLSTATVATAGVAVAKPEVISGIVSSSVQKESNTTANEAIQKTISGLETAANDMDVDKFCSCCTEQFLADNGLDEDMRVEFEEYKNDPANSLENLLFDCKMKIDVLSSNISDGRAILKCKFSISALLQSGYAIGDLKFELRNGKWLVSGIGDELYENKLGFFDGISTTVDETLAVSLFYTLFN